MILTIAITLIYILLGIACYIFSFINGAIFVDYALGVFAVINGIITIMAIGLVEKNSRFTKNFMRDIQNIKIKKDNTQREAFNKNEIKQFVYQSLLNGISEAEMNKQLFDAGITQQQLTQAVSELINEGLIIKEDQVSKPQEKEKVKSKKKIKK